MNLIAQVHRTLTRNAMIRAGDLVLVGVSGGADSMALLQALLSLRHRMGFSIEVVHINHRLRAGADADEKFVQKHAQSLNLPCHVVRLNLSRRVAKGGSLEEIAREGRFNAILKTARRIKADRVALAHNRDDLAETVLLRILRGTGLQGLTAIRPLRVIEGQTFIRPLLDVPRRDIEAYLAAQGMTYRTDPTNRQTKYFRNKVRLGLLPLLKKEYQPNIAEILANLAESCAGDYDVLTYQAGEALKKILACPPSRKAITLKRAPLDRLPQAIRRLVIRAAIERLKGNTRTLTLDHIREIEDLMANRPVGAIAHLPGNFSAVNQKNFLTVFKP